MQRFQIAIIIATIYLLVYVVLLGMDATIPAASLLFVLSPLPVIWMAYEILRTPYKGRELSGDEEFGYQDRQNRDLGIF